MKTLSFSHKGKRKTNQDFVLIEKLGPETHLALVADGMGGYEHGDIAAKLVAENIMAFLSTVPQIEPSDIQMAVNKANLAIKQFKGQTETKIGSTVSGIVIQGNLAICFWVGDVKTFLFRNKILSWESKPHSLINDVMGNGSIKNKEQLKKYSHVVTRSIQGDLEKSKISYHKIENIGENDIIIVCSDGVSDLYEGIQIQQLLKTNESTGSAIKEIEQRLLLEAKDNFSLITLEANE